jgi:nucleoprotein TPR
LQTELARLKDQLEVVSNELQTSNKELSQIQYQEEEKRHTAEQEIKTLQGEISRLKEVEEKAQLSQGFYQEDLRAQAHIAQEAQRNYERELVKHAEAAQTVQQLREEVGTLRTEMRTLRTQAETATATLQNSESSWESQKAEYEKELREVRSRADDLVKQNNILHQQFESVASQAQQIRQRTDSDLTALEGQEPPPPGKEDSVEGLREVIKYLRREKEIVDIKFELLQQENRRLKSQLDRTTADLDQTRSLLMSERQKEANAATSSAQHQELLGKINELNLLRESNTTLRHELDRATKRAADLEGKVTQLTGQLAPLEESVRTLQAEIESKDDQMRLLTEDNERWKSRNQQILQKYDRIDPVELQNLKDHLESASKEKEGLTEQLNGQFEKNKQLAAAWKGRYDKAIGDARAKLEQNRETIEGLEAQARNSTTQSVDLERIRQEAESAKAELNQQISSLQAQLEEAKRNPPASATWETEKKGLEESIQHKDQEITRVSGIARGAERGRVTRLFAANANLQREALTRTAELEEQLKTMQAAAPQSATSGTTDEDFEKRVTEEVEKRVSSAVPPTNDAQLQERLAHADTEKQQAVAAAVQANQQAAEARLAELNADIAAKNKQIDDLRASTGSVDVDAKIAEALQAREAELKDLHEKEIKAATDAAFKRFKQPSEEKVREGAAKHAVRLFNERWEKFLEEQASGGNTIIQDQITQAAEEATKKAVEEATKMKDEEFTEKLAKATDMAKKEASMRFTLVQSKLSRGLDDAKAKLDQYEKQFGPLPTGDQIVPQPSPQRQMQQQQPRAPPPPQYQSLVPVQGQPMAGQPRMSVSDLSAQFAGQSHPQQVQPQQQMQQGGNVLQRLQAGRGVVVNVQPRGRGGIPQSQGRVGGGVGRGQQRPAGQLTPQQLQQFHQQQAQMQGHRPAVNRPVVAGSPGQQPPQQQQQQQGRRPSAQQSQLPRPASGLGMNAGAPPFQPVGMKRPLDDAAGQGNQAVGQKRTRTGGGPEHTGNEGQS